jgi:hypothetical protein
MKNIWLKIISLGSLLLALSACTFSAEVAAGEPASPEPATAVASCEEAAGHSFSSDEGGYCFVYPENYCWFPGQITTANSFVSKEAEDAATNRCPNDPLMLHADVVWVSIQVEPANGQTLEELTANFIAGLEGFGLEMEEVNLDGETAVQINNMPGQDISRDLLVVHNDQFYQIKFVPAEANELYAQVTDSFRFLP